MPSRSHGLGRYLTFYSCALGPYIVGPILLSEILVVHPPQRSSHRASLDELESELPQAPLLMSALNSPHSPDNAFLLHASPNILTSMPEILCTYMNEPM